MRDLSTTVRKPGADNDLVELLRRQPAIDEIANQTAERNGARARPARCRRRRRRSTGATPQVGFLRPYAPELVGWFDDFSTTGAYDALGNFSRAGLRRQRLHARPARSASLPVPAELRTRAARRGHADRPQQPLPGRRSSARAPDGSNPYVPSRGLQLRPQPGADRAMTRRARSILALVLAASPPARAVAASAAGAGDEQRYTVVLDNAFGLTEGSDLRSSGVPVGSVEKLDVQRSTARALATIVVTEPTSRAFARTSSARSSRSR